MKMKVNSTSVFFNVTSPFNVLDGMCTGEVEFQAIIVEDKNGKMVLDSVEEIGYISNIVFAGKEKGEMGYKEFQDWALHVDKLMDCDIAELVSNDAEANLDKKALIDFTSKIQLPTLK